MKVSDKDNINFYDENFYCGQKDGSYNSANVIVPIIMDIIQPKSVIDIGCGVATWLSVFETFGADVQGIDGDYVNRNMLYISESRTCW